MTKRAFSLDALRGYAIITMILASALPSGPLPAWMYHAQTGPRSGFALDASLYGITWVDLVFPFFLFALGAALPLSLGSKLERGERRWRLALNSVARGLRLTFFAIFIQHLYPWSTSGTPDVRSWLLAIAGFALLWPMFLRVPAQMCRRTRVAVELCGYAAGVALLAYVSATGARTFSLYYSNIIILVLANMAVFGSLIYLLTWRNPWARVAVLPLLLAVMLASSTPGSWAEDVAHFSPLDWMYQFAYLKYLFVVIPGTLAGDCLKRWLAERAGQGGDTADGDNGGTADGVAGALGPWRVPLVAVLAVAVIVLNLYCLYTRCLLTGLAGTAALVAALYALTRGRSADDAHWHRLLVCGSYLLALGLCFEAYEGGIRKDPSTFSYYFVTAGLACMAMIALSVACDVRRCRWLVRPMEMAGQNPMLAYVAPQLLVVPLLHLAGIYPLLEALYHSAWPAFACGLAVTALPVLVAMLATRLNCFWRT